MSGVPLLVGTRIPVSAITGNHESFLGDGLSPAEALRETAACYPSAGLNRIVALLAFYHANQLQPQP